MWVGCGEFLIKSQGHSRPGLGKSEETGHHTQSGGETRVEPEPMVGINLLFTEQVLMSATVWEYRKAKTGPLRT